MADDYVEHVLPSFWAWLLAPASGGLVAIMLLPIGTRTAWLGGLAVAVVIAALLWRISPVITVRAGVLQVDRARLPLTVISAVEELHGAQVEQAMGPDLDARAHLRHRGWARAAVQIVLTDPDDPTPYWLISTRHPAELASALGHPVPTTQP